MDSHFENDVIAKWLTGPDEHRDMELIEDFAFVEPNERWEAPAGSVVNGASIPSGLWSLVGSPFVGNYRRAAVIHDVYYASHQGKTRQDVDDVFYEAMLVDGVSTRQAKLMYAGVRVGGGPAWEAADLNRARKVVPAVDWPGFDFWFEHQGADLGKDALDDALEERFGPIS